MEVVAKYGGSLIKGHLLYSHNDEYIFACRDTQIIVFNADTCEFIGSFDTRETIISIALHPTNTSQLLAASDKKTVFLFNYEGGISEVKRWNLKISIAKVISAINQPVSRGYLYLCCQSNDQAQKKSSSSIYRFDPSDVDVESCLKLLGQDDETKIVASISKDGRRLCYSFNKKISFWDLENEVRLDDMIVNDLPHQISIHPNEDLVYWAGRKGRIYGATFGKNSQKTSEIHWHPRAPLAFCVAPDGRRILSGGEEAVLMCWDVEQGDKQFLPHFGSSILNITCSNDGTKYGLLLGCNSILIVSSGSLRIVHRHDEVASTSNPREKIQIINDPRSQSSILLNSIPGQLQSFDVLKGLSSPTDRIDVCEQNIIGRGKKDQEMVFSDVYRVAFSADRRWMATYDRLMTEERRLQHDALKFWRLRDGTYHLYSVYDTPHGEPINTIIFSPVKINGFYQCATVGEDAKVKVWMSSGRRIVNMTKAGEPVEQIAWLQHASLTYKKRRCNTAAFSDDGSILAVGFGSSVRFLDPLTLKLLGMVSTTQSNGDLKELLFMGDDLVGCDDESLFVWDLGSLSLRWQLQVQSPISNLKRMDDENFCCILNIVNSKKRINSGHVCVFALNKGAVPISSTHFIKPLVGLQPIKHEDGIFLVAMDNNCQLSILNPKNNKANERFRRSKNGEYIKRHEDYNSKIATTLLQKKTDLPKRPLIKRSILNYPTISIRELVLSDVPSHQLPSTLEAFERFIKYKFPIRA